MRKINKNKQQQPAQWINRKEIEKKRINEK
jgi:hypothetical protein